ncbi:hypothetical protein A2765_04185 [Candidatus Kaiserbacteria bacterium RIFCSPHIGHO2_01_FULL_56_24]|uniref:Uncharacterized protein n=1 Tax=Candidatus Kaiserbacteria bacterium RIFCSPHIGHO2_01_FULL_56_24 TaxID=1798487 RepID=A0A1F6DEA6_9BACT|nr:MAG: hypothetical protein A2765_04185 [Candidatus Kaiserbacteria bacterium RIFCSPHIGHO2_01_FULL_56_24]
MRRYLVIALIIIAAAGAFYWYGRSRDPAASNAQPTPMRDYKDATYEIEGAPVTLVNGVAERDAAPGSASKIVTTYFGNEAKGDLSGDGLPDIAFLLTQSGGGSGTFYYVVVALQAADGGYAGTNAVLLGDRIAPQTTEISNGTLTVNYADRKPDEPMTAQPSQGVSRYLRMDNGRLIGK